MSNLREYLPRSVFGAVIVNEFLSLLGLAFADKSATFLSPESDTLTFLTP